MTDLTQPSPKLDRARGLATLAGFSAVIMWSLLALLTDATAGIPPFQTAAISFGIGALVGMVWLAVRGDRASLLPKRRQFAVCLIGALGLFGYHALYFAALKAAPAIEASLIAYLWPLLIVSGSALLPGERLRWFHIAGACTGFAGTALIVTGGGGLTVDARHATGYALALAAALTWASYSLLARRFSAVPTGAVVYYCAAAALLSALFSLGFEGESRLWPLSAEQWRALAGLGLLPVGAAFYVWDHGVKHGNIQLVGASSYAAPLLSTLILIVAGRGEATIGIVAACLLITAGAALAARDVIGPAIGRWWRK